MCTTLPRARARHDVAPAIILALVVVIAAALLYTTLFQALDDPIASAVLTLTGLLAVTTFFGSAMRKRP